MPRVAALAAEMATFLAGLTLAVGTLLVIVPLLSLAALGGSLVIILRTAWESRWRCKAIGRASRG